MQRSAFRANELPTELLEFFFFFATQRDGNYPEVYSSPFTLTLVSRRWRAIAIEYPGIWSNVHIKGHDSHLKIDVWLQRSKSLPLDIAIHPCKTKQITSIIEILLLHSHRWRTFYLVEDYQSVRPKKVPQIFPLLKLQEAYAVQPLPRLEVLELQGRKGMAPVYSHLYRTLQFEAPLLRKLVLRDFTHNWSWFRVPVQRVTHLELKLMRYKE
ncbi:hypothetical protein FRC02_007716 [Tulasnella sp. 418]|nr:hypothetical protein FRC02_007716 [Tulasnella sp. 418]